MPLTQVDSEWNVEWATPTPCENYFENLVLSEDEAVEYGDELVWTLRVNGDQLREMGLDPREPFAWKIEDGELLTKEISRQVFENVAESDHKDAHYAQEVLEYRARRRLSSSQ